MDISESYLKSVSSNFIKNAKESKILNSNLKNTLICPTKTCNYIKINQNKLCLKKNTSVSKERFVKKKIPTRNKSSNVGNNKLQQTMSNSSHSIEVPKNKKPVSPIITHNTLCTTENTKDKEDDINTYIKRNKELKSSIDKLKGQISKEQEGKMLLQNEVNKYKQKIFSISSSQMNMNNQSSNKNTVIKVNNTNNSNNNISLVSLSKRVSNLIEMVISFSYSMSSLRDSIYKKNSSAIDQKQEYNKLRQKLFQLLNDLLTSGNNLNKLYENMGENFQSKIPLLTTINENNINSNQIKLKTSLTTKKTSTEIELLKKENIDLKEANKTLKIQNEQLSNQPISKSNDISKENNDKEIKELKSKLSIAEKQINTLLNNEKKEKEKEKENEYNSIKANYDKENKELKETIKQSQREIQQLQMELERKNLSEDLLKNIKDNNEKNISIIKRAYDNIINDKIKTIEKITKENETLRKEIENLNEKNSLTQTELRKQKILYESSISNLINEKVSLEIEIQHLQSDYHLPSNINEYQKENEELNEKINKLNAYIENQKTQINHLNEILSCKDKVNGSLNEINENKEEVQKLQEEIAKDKLIINQLREENSEKSKQLNVIAENHQNDLNELNTSIILLKSQIAKLQEENITLSYSQRNKS